MAFNAFNKSESEPGPEPEPEPKHKQIVAQHASTSSREAQDIEVEETNKQKELQFKANHALFVCFLLWIWWVNLKHSMPLP